MKIPLKIKNKSSSKKGLTLIEILAVISLVVLIYGFFFQGTQQIFGVSVTSSLQRFASLVRYTHNQAILTGQIHRIVLDLGKEDASRPKQSWHIEIGTKDSLPVDTTKQGLLLDYQDEENRIQKKEVFDKIGKRYTAKIPKSIRIQWFHSWRLANLPKSGTKTGKVFIYAYPNGLMDEAKVYMSEAKKSGEVQMFILSINPLTGKVKISSELQKLE